MRPKLSLKRKLALLVEDFGLYLRNKRAGTLPSDSKADDPNTFWNFYLFKRPLAYVPITIGALIALTAPLDVMDRLVWLQPLSDWLRSVFLPMNGYIHRSAFPQVTELYFLVMVLHAPVHFYYFHQALRSDHDMDARKMSWQTRSGTGRAWFCAAVLLLALPLPVAFVLNDGIDLTLIPINSSRIALAWLGWLFAGGGAFILAAIVVTFASDILSGRLNQPMTSTGREHKK